MGGLGRVPALQETDDDVDDDEEGEQAQSEQRYVTVGITYDFAGALG
ncbi:hypothetical protein [Rhodococcus pyridinivorans]|nr:hypothetical protein [Rhodococcus pyridinivorans]